MGRERVTGVEPCIAEANCTANESPRIVEIGDAFTRGGIVLSMTRQVCCRLRSHQGILAAIALAMYPPSVSMLWLTTDSATHCAPGKEWHV
jgi:hypothetical protein